MVSSVEGSSRTAENTGQQSCNLQKALFSTPGAGVRIAVAHTIPGSETGTTLIEAD